MFYDVLLRSPAPLRRCSLLDLPPEVRLEIHKYVLTQDVPFRVPLRPILTRPLHEWRKISLLATSKQIYSDAFPLFYQTNAIWIPDIRCCGNGLGVLPSGRGR
jgi:hypothetical protein